MNWSADIDRKLPEPVRVIFRGAGQVVFCSNAVTGLFVLVAFYISGINHGMAATVGVVCSTVTAYALRFCSEDIKAGMYGFNGILAGVCVSVFFSDTPQLWLYIVLAATLSSIVWAMMTKILQFCRLPAATSPFVLISWAFLMIRYSFDNSLPEPPSLATTSMDVLAVETLFVAFSHAISQILFSDNVLSGGLLLTGMAIASKRAAFMAMGGAIIGVVLPLAIGIEPKIIADGLYGFNPVLTMIAIGWVFFEPSARTAVLAAMGGIMAVLCQVALSDLFAPIGLPVLASPFILTLWLVLLAVYKFKNRLAAASI